jgi:hypothetical protein
MSLASGGSILCPTPKEAGMSDNGMLPAQWDDERDTAFFRLMTNLFSPSYAAGASALLASYDDAVPASAVEPSAPSRAPLHWVRVRA